MGGADSAAPAALAAAQVRGPFCRQTSARPCLASNTCLVAEGERDAVPVVEPDFDTS